ncbi:MAG: ABC transporter permease subunit [Anaerolineae bacterium]|jgi:peptide/nickel transport system permease protein
MSSVAADPLQEAQSLINAGQSREASVLLSRFLVDHPDNEQAWHMLSYAVTDRDQQIFALNRVLQLNPDNRAARAALDRLYRHKVDPATKPAPKVATRRAPSPAASPDVAVLAPTKAARTPGAMLKGMLSRPSLALGLLIVLVFFLTAAAAPLMAPPVAGENPYIIPQDGFGWLPQPPSPQHPLGLLSRQQDVLYGLVWGTRTALKVSLFVTLGRLLIGVLVGLVSGHYGRWVDAVLMRFTDAFMAFPIIAAVMVTVALFAREANITPTGRMFIVPSREEQVIILTLVVFGWMSYARLLRGNVLAEREKEYVQAARAIGAGHRRVIFRHLFPNSMQGLFVMVASDLGAVVVLLTMFAFIGLVRPSTGMLEADWGQMLSLSRDWIIGTPSNAFEYWYTYIPVSLAVVLFSVGWNLIGDGLRDVLDPRLRKASPRLARSG